MTKPYRPQRGHYCAVQLRLPDGTPSVFALRRVVKTAKDPKAPSGWRITHVCKEAEWPAKASVANELFNGMGGTGVRQVWLLGTEGMYNNPALAHMANGTAPTGTYSGKAAYDAALAAAGGYATMDAFKAALRAVADRA